MNLNFLSEQEHIKRLEAYSLQFNALYNKTIEEFAFLIKRIDKVKANKIFSFKNHPQLSGNLTRLLNKYIDSLIFLINKSTSIEWYEAFKKQDTRVKHNAYTKRNQDALKSFQGRVENGLNLSNKVWNYTQQFQQEIELAVSATILEGKPASVLAKEIKHLLKEPDRLFRRVRNKHGLLQLSSKAKAYHPGQGVYRSSYKNALRLARNEPNIAYRTADYIRYQNDVSVVGFEVKLSNSHPVRDICDDLAGKYPKTFKFVCWHANCLCYQIPIVVNDKDWQKIQAAIVNGERLPANFKPSNLVESVPSGFNDWVEANKERAKGWKNTPYFIRDNFKQGKLGNGLKL